MCNLSAVILPVITFQRYHILTTSVQTRCSALILRLIKFQRYHTQGYEIVCFHFWPDDIKLKTQILVLQLLHRTPSKPDVSVRKPKHETIMDHKPRKIVNDLRLISLQTNLAYYTEDFVLSALHKDRTDDQDDGNFKKGRLFSLLHSLRSNTTTNFRPAARAYSQRYHLLLSLWT